MKFRRHHSPATASEKPVCGAVQSGFLDRSTDHCSFTLKYALMNVSSKVAVCERTVLRNGLIPVREFDQVQVSATIEGSLVSVAFWQNSIFI